MEAARTVVVTGGTRGLGREISLEFGRHGYRVLALYQRDAEAAARLDAELGAEKLSGRAFRHDITGGNAESPMWSQPEIEEAASLVLIHNASAAFEPKPLHLLRWEDFSCGFDVAVKGCWLTTLGLLRPMLKKGGGTIVTVSTSALSSTPKGFASYLAAKGALRAFTESIAAEYRSRGIRVFAVAPGFMRTPLTQRWHAAFREAVLRSSVAADPAEVARAIRTLVENPALAAKGESYDV